MMVPEMEKPRVTEIKVRMDCNGCVQKIKKALHGITGIQDIYIDFPQQKITIIGWAEPEKIVKAIKKTRKSAVICLHTEQQPNQPAPEGEEPPADPTTPPPEPTEPPKEQPQPENPPPEPNPSPENANVTPKPEMTNATPRPEMASATSRPEMASTTSRPDMASATPSQPKDQEEIHVIHHHPPNYGYQYPNFQQGYTGQWNSYHGGPQFRDGPSQKPQPSQPVYVTHSYNTHQPSPYVTEYAYAPSQPRYSPYNGPDKNTHYSAPDYNTRYGAPDYNTGYGAPDHNMRYAAPDYNTRYGAPDYNARYGAPDYNMRYGAPDYNERYSGQDYNAHNSVPDYYNRNYYGGNNGNGNITSMFSEENPNACRIV